MPGEVVIRRKFVWSKGIECFCRNW